MKNRIDETRKLLDLVNEAKTDVLPANDPLVKILNLKLKEVGAKKKAGDLINKMELLEKGKVDPSTLGPFGFLFEWIDYEITVGGSNEERLVTFIIEYNWKHSYGGSNGKTIRLSYWERDGKWRY